MAASELMVLAKGLGRSFDDLAALRGLNIDVFRGELFGLVGPDGAGKTTFLRILAGVLPPTAGEVVIDGTSVVEGPETVKGQIAYMSQKFGLYGDLTVMENIEFYADLYQVPKGERDRRLDRLFEFSGLAQFRNRLAGNLSGGMKQKLGLSCALIHAPDLLLLDEPTFGVDPVSRRELWLIVHEMVAEGVTVIVSTAYMDEAERFDRVALLDAGTILAIDEPQLLQKQLPTVVFEVRLDRPRKALAAVRRGRDVLSAALFGDRIHVSSRAMEEGRSSIEDSLESAGISEFSIERVQPSMEDVFIYHVREARDAGRDD